MATQMTVYQDEKGPYVRHSDQKVRPIAAGTDARLYSGENNAYRQAVEEKLGKRIRWDGQTAHQAGARVLKTHHSQTVRCTIKGLDGGDPEIWFIQEEETAPRPAPTLEEYRATRAPGNGISYADYCTLLEMEEKDPPREPRKSRTEGGFLFVDYQGTCAEFPRRSFEPSRKREAQRYLDDLTRHIKARPKRKRSS